jgi:hypothetical protein
MTAKDFWKKKFDEYPQTDADKLAVVMMREYADSEKADFMKRYHSSEICQCPEPVAESFTDGNGVHYTGRCYECGLLLEY